MAKKRRKVKRKLKVGRIVLALIILILIVLGVTFVISKVISDDPKPSNEHIADDNKEEVTSLNMIMVGDALIHSSIYNDALEKTNYNGYDFASMLTYIKDIVSDYDLAYYNQETILGGDEIGLSDYPTFNSPYEFGDAMLDAGFNMVSLATNHTFDRGEEGVENSCAYWKQHEDDVLYAGSYCSLEERNEVKVKEMNGITYSMLSYTYGTNGIYVPEDEEYMVNVWPTDLAINDPLNDSEYQAYKEQVKKDVEAVRDKVDVLMVAMHWGVEYTHTPTAYQEDMADYLASLGVDIIIGSHPHVIQPVTWIDDTLVIYSLGNFISAQETDMDYAKMVGLMPSLTITKTTKGDNVDIEISNIKNDLIFTYYSGWRNFKVVPFSSPDIYDYISDASRLYNEYSVVVKDMDETMVVSELG